MHVSTGFSDLSMCSCPVSVKGLQWFHVASLMQCFSNISLKCKILAKILTIMKFVNSGRTLSTDLLVAAIIG